MEEDALGGVCCAVVVVVWCPGNVFMALMMKCRWKVLATLLAFCRYGSLLQLSIGAGYRFVERDVC